MLSAVLILIFAFFTVFFVPAFRPEPIETEENVNHKDPQLKKLWSLAQTAMRERKPLKAEKALLTILKFDEKNAAAYNRLGILYAKEKHYKEAIECFEIAQSLDNNASSLHNVGLIYYETGKYEKAAMAFAQAISLEGDQPARYIAYAKALEKLGERAKAVDALETAYSLGPNTVILRHLLELYENANDVVNIEITKHRIDELQAQKAELEAKAATAKQKRSLIERTYKKKKVQLTKEERAQAKIAAKNQRATEKAEAKLAKDDARAAQARAKANAKMAAKQKAAPTSRPATTKKPANKLARKRKII